MELRARTLHAGVSVHPSRRDLRAVPATAFGWKFYSSGFYRLWVEGWQLQVYIGSELSGLF